MISLKSEIVTPLIPIECDLCEGPLLDWYVDGRTHIPAFGMVWLNMCSGCYARYGLGLGTGKGQLYHRSKLEGHVVWVRAQIPG